MVKFCRKLRKIVDINLVHNLEHYKKMVIRVEQYSKNQIQNSQRFFALLHGGLMTILGIIYYISAFSRDIIQEKERLFFSWKRPRYHSDIFFQNYSALMTIFSFFQQLRHKRTLQNIVNKSHKFRRYGIAVISKTKFDLARVWVGWRGLGYSGSSLPIFL